ncbi:MAG: thioesterase family protein [Isosphaeraceae bacterium]|nr:thioesterase family protein [Isosphaeraceae bacterium]
MATPEWTQFLLGFPVTITLPVQWGDQDAFGHVNNTVYFRWYESSRIAYGQRVGMHVWKETQNIGPILASITCDYRRQVTFPDTIHVGARVTRIGRSSMTMEHVLVSEATAGVAAEGSSTIVMFDYNANRSYSVPEEIRRAIEQLEGRSY